MCCFCMLFCSIDDMSCWNHEHSHVFQQTLNNIIHLVTTRLLGEWMLLFSFAWCWLAVLGRCVLCRTFRGKARQLKHTETNYCSPLVCTCGCLDARHIQRIRSDRRDSEATSASGGICSAVGSQAQLSGLLSFHFSAETKCWESKGRKNCHVGTCWQEATYWTLEDLVVHAKEEGK